MAAAAAVEELAVWLRGVLAARAAGGKVRG